MSKPLILELKEKIEKLETYSTEEINTGEYWIDGKPIYRKTFTKTGTGSIDISGLNADKIFFDFSNSYLKMISPARIIPLEAISTAESGSGKRQAGVYREGNNLVIEARKCNYIRRKCNNNKIYKKRLERMIIMRKKRVIVVAVHTHTHTRIVLEK